MPRKSLAPLSQPIFDEPVFNEVTMTPDPTGFVTLHKDDKEVYKEIQDLLSKDVVSFDPSRGAPGDVYALKDALGDHGDEIVQKITAAGQIVFHCGGDSGSTSAGKQYLDELSVADHLSEDCQTAAAKDRPAFLFHLGDLVYDFGESEYYYDQFYEPFRNYPAPIFAIPGNHDSFTSKQTEENGEAPLTIFERNLCAKSPVVTQEAKSLHRTAMTQPGVYFALDAPFVRIIGLFSNALEDPGVISSQKGQKQVWKGLPDVQLDYLRAQLQGIKKGYEGAVILAVHHPPFSYAAPPAAGKARMGGAHGCSPYMLREIDQICLDVGVYPHAFLSGHAHNEQRYTRTINFNGDQFQVPFIICGNMGHHVNSIVSSRGGQKAVKPAKNANVGYLDAIPVVKTQGLVLNYFDDTGFGYLRITADAKELEIKYQPVTSTGKNPLAKPDVVTVNLEKHQIA
jgi:hypothetical protein